MALAQTGATFEYIQQFVQTLFSAPVIALIAVFVVARSPQLVGRITGFDIFGIKLQLEKIDRKIETTTAQVNEVQSKLDNFQQSYLNIARPDKINAPARNLDELTRRLKIEASTLESIDFCLDLLKIDTPHDQILAAAAAIQIRPQSKFFTPVAALLQQAVKAPNLGGIRLRIHYRLVMDLQNIVRIDNQRAARQVDLAQRQMAVGVLQDLERHERSQEDLRKNGARSIVPRIDATLRLIRQPELASKSSAAKARPRRSG